MIALRGMKEVEPSKLCSVRPQIFQGDKFERAEVRRCEHDGRRAAGFKRLLPARHAQAPTIAREKPGKIEFGDWRAQIVALLGGEFEELIGHDRANCVQPAISRTGAAVAIAIEARRRIAAAAFEFATENVCGFSHAVLCSLKQKEATTPAGLLGRDAVLRLERVMRLWRC